MVQFKRGWLKGSPATTEISNGKKVRIPARPAWKEEDVVRYFKLVEKVTERIVVIDWGGTTIKTYTSAEDVIVSFAAWRLTWYTKRFEKKVWDTNYEINYWKVLRALFQDGFTTRLGKFADRSAVEADVTKVAKKSKLVLDDKQMDRVVSLPTYRWTKDFEAEVETKIAALETSVAEYLAILADPDKLKAVYVEELDEVKKKLV
jgi:DNA gyrase/topoisomerase IV subunit A